MIKSGYTGFLIFISMMIVFFVLPDPTGIQKPFRIILGLSFVVIYIALLIKEEIKYRTLWPLAGGALLIVVMIFKGTLQTSLINAYLCLFGLLCLPHLFFTMTPVRKTNLIYIHILCIVSFIIQVLMISSDDGRPSLDYQINLAGAYLFLFFMLSDVMKNQLGKTVVIVLSLFLLCRLLIFSIILFYIVRQFKKYFRPWIQKLRASTISVITYVAFALFSIWYVANVTSRINYDTSISRIGTINDGSNQLRFLVNKVVLSTISGAPFSEKVLFGFGEVGNFMKSKTSLVMPHNEALDGVIEFGIIAVLFFAFFSLPAYNKVTTYDNIEYFIPALFHTLVLWVRFLLIPSFEMLFILFLMNIARKRESNGDMASQSENRM